MLAPPRLYARAAAGSVLAASRQIFLVLAPLLYATYAILTPPFQSFDENQHLYRAWQISEGQWRTERRGTKSGGDLPPGLIEATIKEIGDTTPHIARTVRTKPLHQIFDDETPFGTDRPRRFVDFKGAAVYSPIGYLPQAATVAIGGRLDWSVEATVRAGRLLNAAIAIALISLAIGLLPFGRGVMTTVALLPPSSAAAANFGQDGLLLGTTFLLTALGLRTIADGGWTWRRMALAAPAAIAAAAIKFVYLPLAAVSLLPWPNRQQRLQRLLPPLALTFMAAAIVAAWLVLNASSMVAFKSSLPTASEQVARIASSPLAYLTLVAQTFVLIWPHLALGMYTFGDSTVLPNVAAWLAGMFGLTLAMAAGEEIPSLSQPLRLWLLTICVGVVLAIATALYITYTPPDFPIIRGMQGRYFLPMLPLLGIALMRRGPTSSVLLIGSLTLLGLSHALVFGSMLTAFYPS
jgi:uncharacterized membrane protein